MSDLKKNENLGANGVGTEKKSAIIAGLLTGKTPAELEKDLQVSQPTISRIWKEVPEQFKEFALDQRFQNRQEEITILVQDNLAEALQSTIRIAKHTEDAEWLKKQDAGSLATLYGVISDKTVRVLGALERAQIAANHANGTEAGQGANGLESGSPAGA